MSPGSVRSARAGLRLDLSAHVTFVYSRRTHAFRFHHARIDGVDAHPARTEFARQGAGNGVQSRLVCTADCTARPADQRRNGADVADAAAVGTEAPRSCLRAQERPENIAVELPLEQFFRHTIERGNWQIPALFTSMSSLPRNLSAAANSLSTSAPLDTSACTRTLFRHSRRSRARRAPHPQRWMKSSRPLRRLVPTSSLRWPRRFPWRPR